MDLASLSGAPREIVLDGTTWLVSALKLREWGAMQAWIKDHCPNPISVIRSEDLRGLDPDDRQVFLQSAFQEARNWPPRVGSLQWMRLLDETSGGAARFLLVVLGKHQPSFTLEQAERLADRIGQADTVKLLYMAFGMEPPDPKEPAPEPGPTTSPSPTNGAAASTGSPSTAGDGPTSKSST